MKDKILAIESSCDDTSVAVVDMFGVVHAWEQVSQSNIHLEFGGVVPEVASRYHEKALYVLCQKVLSQVRAEQIACVAGTSGPGLVGPLLVGRCFGEGLARSLGVEFRGIHHLRGHIASSLLSDDDALNLKSLKIKSEELFPAFVLLVSGGHTQILFSRSNLEVTKLADTADDSAGECFDKIAKILGLGYPGGPEIEKRALKVTSPEDLSAAREFAKILPRPKSSQGFSFSGLKTAARLLIEKNPHVQERPDIFCYALQEVIADTLRLGFRLSVNRAPKDLAVKSFVMCGGVSANRRVREVLTKEAQLAGLKAYFPPLKFCTDNAAMIGAAAWVQNSELDLKEVLARIPL